MTDDQSRESLQLSRRGFGGLLRLAGLGAAGSLGASASPANASQEMYKEMVEDLDRSIGQVMTALRRSGQLADTLVFFASDNGGERFSYYWPFSGGKGNVYEGGIRVPTLLSWPGTLPSRQVSDAPVITQDWTASFLEHANACLESRSA